MTDPASADTPAAIDRVDLTRDEHGVQLRLTGRWLAADDAAGSEPLLVVQVQGRRHRFAPARDHAEAPGRDHADAPERAPGAFEATFHLPAWAQPRREGQAALWVGTSVVPIPLPGGAADGTHRLPAPPALGEARAWPPDVAPPPPGAEPARLGEMADPAVDTGRTGPLAELLFKESVSALHAELEQRSADVARLQGSLADAQSELEARSGMQSALESAHGDLRVELQELMSAVGAQRDDYERRLAGAEERLATAEQRLAAAQEGLAGAEADRDRLREEVEVQRGESERAAEAEGERVRAELEARQESQRAVEAERARLQAELEAQRLDAHRELEAQRLDAQRELEAQRLQAHRTLEAERAHAGAQLAALRDQLAAAQVSRDAAAGEVAGLRAELERLGSELAVTREHQSAHGAELGEAQRLLAEARSLSEQLRSQSSH